MPFLQLRTQSALIQRYSERVEGLERLTARTVAVQEGVQRVLDKMEQRAELEAERHRR